jgi:hypothetical protein
MRSFDKISKVGSSPTCRLKKFKVMEYIDERMKEMAENINEFGLGQIVYDYDNSECYITDMTRNSIEVFINKKIYIDKKGILHDDGINCKNWFTIREFNKRFKVH